MTETRKKIFLHIGTPKTGSTALQAFLDSQSDTLAKCGVIFPKSGRIKNQHYFLASPHSNNPHQSKQAWSELYSELDSNSWRSAVLSSELFCLHPEPQEIYDACRQLNAEPHIILFLRKRKALIDSYYRTSIKSWPRICCSADVFIPYFFEKYKRLLNYDKLIEKWGDVFGSQCVHVISYDEVCLDSNTPAAFCKILNNNGVNIPTFSDEIFTLRANETQPDVVLDLILRANQFHYGDFPYWKVIRHLFRCSEEIRLNATLTTSNMQPTEEGRALIVEKANQWRTGFLSYFSKEGIEIYRRNPSPW